MTQYIKQASISGRIGSGIGKGLAEQIPKEIDRERLASGLKQFAENAKEMSPIQQGAYLAGIPGAAQNPQLLQTMGELAKYEAKAKGFGKQQASPITRYPGFENEGSASKQSESQIPSTTKPETQANVLAGLKFLTEPEKDVEAAKRFNANPQRWGNNPEDARQAVDRDEAIKQQNYQQQKDLLETQNLTQKTTTEGLRNHSNNLSVKVPANVYSKLEDKAIELTKPISEGGKGYTSQQALKEIGKELDEISREYSDVKSLGGIGVLGRRADKTLSAFSKAQKEFEKRDDTRNLADYLVSTANISYPLSYSVAEPVHKTPELNRELKTLASLPHLGTAGSSREKMIEETLKASPKIGKVMKDASPLAIAYELAKKNYDPSTFIDWLEKNQYDKLTGRQIEQLGKPVNEIGSLNDWWLQGWSGIGE